MKNLLLSMSLSGSVIVVLYIFFYPLAKRYLPNWWRYAVLVLAMFFYLFPMPLFQYKIREFLALITIFDEEGIVIERAPFDPSYMIVISDERTGTPDQVKYTGIIIAVSVILSVCAVLYIVFKYLEQKKRYMKLSTEEVPRKWRDRFCETKKQMRMGRWGIRLRFSRYCESPLAIGMFSPVIVFPVFSEDDDEESFDLMLRHELAHIKHGDLILKVIGLLTVAIHWFNPIVYFLFYELCNMSEVLCDESVVKRQPDSWRQKYSNLILFYAQKGNGANHKSLWANLSGNAAASVLKRRVLEMKSNRKRNLAVSLLLILVFSMTGTMMAFAYEPPTQMNLGNESFTLDIQINDGPVDLEIEDMPYDFFYIDENGEACVLYDDEGITPYCNHVFSNVKEVTRHSKNNDGSCDVVKGSGQVCIKCGYAEITGEPDLTMHYRICPH